MQRKIEMKKIFPLDLIEKYSKPNPAEEDKLEEYVSELLNEEPDVDVQLDILFQTATIDILNERRNFWIIKKAFEVASFDGEVTLQTLQVAHSMSMVQDFTSGNLFDPKRVDKSITYERYIPSNGSLLQKFLLKLKNYIPQSPFMWFYLQSSLRPIAKNDWMKLFDTYNLENIKEVKEAIFSHFIEEWLHCSAEFKAICIGHAKGTLGDILVACEKLFTFQREGGAISDAELNIAVKIYNRTREICASNLIGDEKPLSRAMLELERKNYKQAIEILAPIASDPQEKENYTPHEWNIIYGILAQSHELSGDTDTALVLYETVYPRIVLSGENDFGMKKLVSDAIVKLKSKVDVSAPKTDFFKDEANPLSLYNQSVEQVKQNKYSDAISSSCEALALFIPQKGLISRECMQCYSLTALAEQKLGNLKIAYLQCNMAYALARQLFKENHDELHVLETQLRQLEIETKLLSENEAEVQSETRLTL